jgi:hypothetical protein
VDFCFKRIILVQVIEVFFDLLVGLLNEGVEFALGEVLASTIYGFEFAAVNSDEFSAEKIALPTEKGEGAADPLDCFAEGPGQGGYLVESRRWF